MADTRYRHPKGRIAMAFPKSAAYRAQVVRTATGQGDEYRRVMQRGVVHRIRLTDDELEWLLGFDADVAQHDAQYEALVDRHGR